MGKAPSLEQPALYPISFVKKGKTMNFFSMITTVGAPLSITCKNFGWNVCFRPTKSRKNTT